MSREQVSFDSNGNSVGAYDITVVNTETEQWEPIGNWVSNTSNEVEIPANVSFLNIDLTKLRMLWKKVFNNSVEPTSFCGKECPPGNFMVADEHYQVSWLCYCCFVSHFCCCRPQNQKLEHFRKYKVSK